MRKFVISIIDNTLPRTTSLLAVAAMMATSAAAWGQVIPADTTFFDYDFSANDQMTAQFGTRNADTNGDVGGDAAGQPNDNGGIFTGGIDNLGPFADGPLASQVGFNNSGIHQNLNVDTAGGFATETATSPTNYPTGNIFIGQPKVSVGDTVRLISELSFTKNLVDDGNGTLVESNSQFDNFFFGFRGGIGTNEFAPNDGITQSFRYNLGGDNAIDSDSNIQVFVNANGTSSAGGTGDGNVALGPVSSLGIDIANGDVETDVFRIVTDAVVTAANGSTITFEITTSIEDQAGNVLGTTPAVTTASDTGIALAGDRIQFAIRDGQSSVDDPSNLKIHRLAAIFNPSPATNVLKGDVNLDGSVTFLDIQPFINVLASNGNQAEADCSCDGSVTFLDIQPFINILAGNP